MLTHTNIEVKVFAIMFLVSSLSVCTATNTYMICLTALLLLVSILYSEVFTICAICHNTEYICVCMVKLCTQLTKALGGIFRGFVFIPSNWVFSLARPLVSTYCIVSSLTYLCPACSVFENPSFY